MEISVWEDILIALKTSFLFLLLIAIFDQSKTFAQLGTSFPDIFSLTIMAPTATQETGLSLKVGRREMSEATAAVHGMKEREQSQIIGLRPTRASLCFHARCLLAQWNGKCEWDTE